MGIELRDDTNFTGLLNNLYTANDVYRYLGVYDSYSVYLKFNAENEKFPIARIAVDFYEEGEGW